MAESTHLVDQLYRTLDEVAPDQMMPVIRQALASAIDATDVVLVLADYAEESLERFDHDRPGAPSRAGRSRSSRPCRASASGARRSWSRRSTAHGHAGSSALR